MVHFAPVMRRLATASLATVFATCASGVARAESLTQALVTLYNNSHY